MQKCYRTLDLNGDGQLDSRELEPISRALNQNHQDVLQMMGINGNGVAGPDQFAHFVVEQCVHGLQNGQVVQGLQAMLLMGGDGLLTLQWTILIV